MCCTAQQRVIICRVLLFPAIALFLLQYYPGYEFFRSPYYVVPSALLIAGFAFGGFHILSDYIHTKEIKIEDLRDAAAADARMKAKYERRYRVLFIIVSIGFVGSLTYYTIFVAMEDDADIMTNLGTVGGIMTMFVSGHRFASEMLMYYLFWMKERKNKQTPPSASGGEPPGIALPTLRLPEVIDPFTGVVAANVAVTPSAATGASLATNGVTADAVSITIHS